MALPQRTPARPASALSIALVAVLAIALALLWLPAQSRAADDSVAGSAHPDSAELKELPDLLLTPWLSSQTRHGNFKRPSGTPLNDGYANAGIAYAMLLEAARSGDERYFNSAMRAFSWITRTRYPMFGVFYQMFSASAYNLAREKFARRSAFRKIRHRWANQLRRFPYQSRRRVLGSSYRYNKDIVEAVQVIELYRSGLRGNSRTAILRDRRTALKRAVRLMNVWIPRAAARYSLNVNGAQGWPFRTGVAMVSDPPNNPPAYNAFSAGLYARAYSRMPIVERTERMRTTAESMIDGVIARAAPDGDIAFDGRSQEQAWALSSAAYAAWNASTFEVGALRTIHLAFARRVVSRLENVHVTPKSSFGFVLTPAAGCCDKRDKPPGQDHYYDVGKYSGLTALTMGWAIAERPGDWSEGSDVLPTDRVSNLNFGKGTGRFYQHRGESVYWFLRQQSDFWDARADMGVAVLKVRRADGTWVDAVPPRPYTGGHHRPADPAAPCLVYRSGCAYLELTSGRLQAPGYRYTARWRTPRGTLVRRGSALVTPTATGLTLSWSSRAADKYQLDTFLAGPSCSGGAASTSSVTITLSGGPACQVMKTRYAGGARTNLRKARIRTRAGASTTTATYAAR